MRKMLPPLLVIFLLVGLTVLVYYPVRNYQFTNYDDNIYVYENPHVATGWSWANIRWAFTSFENCNWHPLTWLSHQLDVQLFTLQNPGGFHLVNLFWHILGTVLLFLFLLRATGQILPAGLVAGLFALHPLHVESVAWIAERKDVLSGFFWILCLWAYLFYVRKPGIFRYLPLFFSLALGLLAKPMLVTLPFALLLLDYWPLGRWPGARAENPHLKLPPVPSRWLILEKIPLLGLVAVSSIFTYLAQNQGGAVATLEKIKFTARLANAVQSYFTYLMQTFQPVKLACFYPFPGRVVTLHFLGISLILVLITFFAFRARRGFAWFWVGWLWYLGTLAPVIGIVQVGMQAHADRYHYLPGIGLFLVLAWGLMTLLDKKRGPDEPRPANWYSISALVAVGVALAACGWLSRQQLPVWSDSVSLFSQAIKVSQRNYIACNNLANVYKQQGVADMKKGDLGGSKAKIEKSIRLYEEAIAALPTYCEAMSNLANAYTMLDRNQEAIVVYKKALAIRDLPQIHLNLGITYLSCNQPAAAILEFETARKSMGDDYAVLYCLGDAYAMTGRIADARETFEKALRLKPELPQNWYKRGMISLRDNPAEAAKFLGEFVRRSPQSPTGHYYLAEAWARSEQMDQAIAELTRALALRENWPEAHNQLALILQSLGKNEEAAAHFRRIVELKPDSADAHSDYGNILVSLKKTDEAAAEYEIAARLQPGHPQILFNWGLLLFDLKNYAAAEQKIQGLLQAHPEDAEAWVLSGRILQAQGKKPEARRALKQAIQLDPANQTARQLLGDWAE